MEWKYQNFGMMEWIESSESSNLNWLQITSLGPCPQEPPQTSSPPSFALPATGRVKSMAGRVERWAMGQVCCHRHGGPPVDAWRRVSAQPAIEDLVGKTTIPTKCFHCGLCPLGGMENNSFNMSRNAWRLEIHQIWMEKAPGFGHKTGQIQYPYILHGAGIYANIKGVYWWDPC